MQKKIRRKKYRKQQEQIKAKHNTKFISNDGSETDNETTSVYVK